MALVAYDYDSNSNSENEEEDDSSSVVIVKEIITETKPNPRIGPSNFNDKGKDITNSQLHEINIFSTLPQTKAVAKQVTEDQIEDFIPKSKPFQKEKQKVKISIPSLSQFKNDEDVEPQSKKLRISTKGSGLMSILPPVKGSVTTTKSFVPDVVANKSKNNNARRPTSSGLIPDVVRLKAEAKKTSILRKIQSKKPKSVGSDMESDDEIEVPETFDDEVWEKVCGRPKPKQIIQEPEEPPQDLINIAPEPEKPYDGLDNKAFKELVGKSKRPMGNIKLIDINEEEILPEKDLWMTKSLTDPEMAPKPQIDDPVDTTRRKKHHITYLAQQAKANEQELQNSWSASKNSRMATRAKYGF